MMFESYGPRVSITRDGKTKIKNVKDPLKEFEKTRGGVQAGLSRDAGADDGRGRGVHGVRDGEGF
jgi:hypothetical protein